MNEILKQNDIFVSAILNPEATVSDLLAGGINAENTGLLSPDVYKESKFVQELFTDLNGNFDNDKFTKVYEHALSQYDLLTSFKSFTDLENITAKYDLNDVFAPLNANFKTPTYEIKNVSNPYKTSRGISSLYGEGARTKSDRELAQQHKVWDSTNEKWLDYTADERGLFGGVFGPQLIYATWDEDGWHEDKAIGRKVYHQKGQMKTDENGEFYTETAGDRELYGKQFVSISDTLTKEDSWLNKIDFFDSDGLTKSALGTTFKLIAEIAPYMIPYFNVYYGGLTATYNLLGVMPTFAKMLEGIVPGDHPDFNKKMNVWENYFHGFDDSYSDDAQNSNWGYQKIASMVSDIFGQLYQMRAYASLSNLKNIKINNRQAELFEKFSNDFAESYFKAARDPKNKLVGTPEGMVAWWRLMADLMPEMKALIESQSKLSKSLSLGYMAMTSSADVFSDALQGGYDRRTAGIAALTATAGQYLLMMNNRMGDWFLDATTGYKEGISRNLMKKTMSPFYDKIKEGTDAISAEISPAAKMNVFSKIFNTVYKKGIKGYFNLLKDGGEEFWKKAIIEGTEEVTEEAVMDMTKGVFDTLAWMGVTPNDQASFGGWERVFSEEGLSRYVQNFAGGFLGGALFEFQGNVIEPGIRAAISGKASPEVKTSLVRELKAGRKSEIKQAIHELCSADNEVNALPIKINGESVPIAGFPNITTRGQLIEARLNDYVDIVDSIITSINADMTDHQIFSKFLRDEMLIPMIEDSDIDKLILSDFNKAVSDVVEAKIKLDSEPENSDKIKRLKEDYKNKLDIFNDLNNGKSAKKYVSAALMYLHTNIRERVLDMDKYTWTQAKYNISYNDKSIPDSGEGLSRESIDKEYQEWKDSEHPEQKFIQIVVPAYDRILRIISPKAKEYVDKYLSVRQNSVKELISDANVLLGHKSQNQLWRGLVSILSKNLNQANKQGITLSDIFNIDPEELKSIIENILKDKDAYFQEYANLHGITLEEAKNVYTENLINSLQSFPISDFDQLSLNALSVLGNTKIASDLFKSLKKDGKSITKDDVNSLLVKLGFSPDATVNLESEKDLFDYFNAITTPKFKEDTKVDLESTLLSKYLDENNIIDNEMVVPIKRIILNWVQNHIKEIENAIKSVRVEKEELNIYQEIEQKIGVLPVSEKDLDLFVSKLYEGLNDNQSIDSIVHDYLFGENGLIVNAQNDSFYQFLIANNPNAAQEIESKMLDVLKQAPFYLRYLNTITKEIVKNPLLELLRTFSFEVSSAGESVLFNLLESESNYISQLRTIDDYIRYGITAEQIDNFIRLLDLFEAVIFGMEEVNELGLENPIAYNQQMQKFIGSDEEGKYATISTEAVTYMTLDLERLKNKLQLAQNIIRANAASLVKEDQNTRDVHVDLLLNHLLAQESKLTLKGVSILPSKDEIDKHKDKEDKLAFIEHEIYTNFQKIPQKDRKEAIQDLFTLLKFDRQNIIDGGLKSFGLNSKIQAISQYDLFVYWATILSTDQHEFLYKYNELINQSWYKHLPKYTQRIAIKVGYSFYKDNQNIHNIFIDELFRDLEKPKLNKISNIYFLNGVTGAGKTSNVAKGLNFMIDPNAEVYFVAPNIIQANRLAESAGQDIDRKVTTIFDKTNLFKLFLSDETLQELKKASESGDGASIIKIVDTHDGMKKYDITVEDKMLNSELNKIKLPSVIFIDEITHFNSAEIAILDYIAKKYNIKIFTFGDSIQKGALIGKYASNIDLTSSWNAPRLLTSTRTQNVNSKDNVDSMATRLISIEDAITKYGMNSAESNKEIKEILSKGVELKYYETDDELHGHKFVSTITKEEIERIAKASKRVGKKFGILANMNGDNFKDTKFENLLKSLGLKKDEDYVLYSPQDFSENAVQGSEAEYFIVKDLGSQTGDIYNDFKMLYTFLTRSLSGTVAVVPNNLKTKLNLHNKKVNYTDLFILPGSDRSQDLKKQESDLIKSLIGNYTPVSTTTIPPKPKKNKEKPTTVVPEKDVAEEETEEDEEPVEPLTDDEEKSVIKEETEAEKSNIQLNQESVDDDSFDLTPNVLWGHSAYTHYGLAYDKENHTYKCTENRGTSLDFDGLIPPTIPIKAEVRIGMSKFQKLISLYPDFKAQEFKQGMTDPDILSLFIAINPNWAVDEDGKLPEKIEDLKNNVYEKLIQGEELKIESKAYVFGKKYDSNVDRAYGFYKFDSEKAINSKEEPLLLYGYRVYTTDKTLNQYISIGSFPSEEKIGQFAKSVPNGEVILNKVKEILSKKSFAVLALKNAKLFTVRTPIRIIKAEPETSYSLADMRSKGLIIDERYIGLISSDMTDGKFDFLEFKAEYESNGDERLKQKKLEQFYKTPQEGGFVETGIDEDGKPYTKLICAGNYFVPVKYTQAEGDKFKAIAIFTPAEINGNDAVINIINMFKKALSKSATSAVKELGTVISRNEFLSVYSLTKLVLKALQEIGAFDENGNPVLVNDVPIAKLYFDRIKKLSEKISLVSSDFSVLDNFLLQDKFDIDSVTEFLEETKFIGILFIDANLYLGEGDIIKMRDLRSSDERANIDLDLSDETYRYNFSMSKKVFYPGSTTSKYFKVNFKNIGFAYSNLVMTGHYIQPPIFNLGNDILRETVEYTKPLERNEIDRSITKGPKEDHSNLKLKEQKERFEKDSNKVVLSKPKIIYNSSRKPLRKKNKSGRYISNYTHIVNQYGWDIIAGDSVQLYGNEKEYIVRHVDKDKNKLILFDPEQEQSFKYAADAVTKVVSRTYKNPEDSKHETYYTKDFKNKIKESIEKKRTKDEKQKLENKKAKFVSADIFDPSELNYDDYIYYAVKFKENEDFQEIINDNKKPFIQIETEQLLQDFIDAEQDDTNAGFTLFRVKKWNNKNKTVRKFDLTIPDKNPQTVIRKKYNSEHDIFGYIQNVILWLEYDPKLEPDAIEALKPAQKSKITKSANLYANKTVQEIAEMYANDEVLKFDSIEDAKAEGFISTLFFFNKEEDGTYGVYPNHKFYEKYNLEVNNNPVFNPGDKIGIKSTIQSNRPEQTITVYDVVDVTDEGYKLGINGKVVDKIRTFAEVNALLNIKYIQNPEENLENETDNQEIEQNVEDNIKLDQEFLDLKSKGVLSDKQLATISTLTDIQKESVKNTLILISDPNLQSMYAEVIEALLKNPTGLISDVLPADADELNELIEILNQLEQSREGRLVCTLDDNNDVQFNWSTEQECI